MKGVYFLSVCQFHCLLLSSSICFCNLKMRKGFEKCESNLPPSITPCLYSVAFQKINEKNSQKTIKWNFARYTVLPRYIFGALKQGPCACITFKAFNLTYLQADIMFIDIALVCSVCLVCARTRTDLWTDLGMCMYHRVLSPILTAVGYPRSDF